VQVHVPFPLVAEVLDSPVAEVVEEVVDQEEGVKFQDGNTKTRTFTQQE